MKITVTIDKGGVDKTLRNLKDNLGGIALDAGAKAVHAKLLRHFRERQREPNKTGWPAREFWFSNKGDSVAERTDQPRLSGDRAEIVIRSAALARKLSSSPKPIKPGSGKKYLAIPATESAYTFLGMPRSYPGIRFAFAHFPGDPFDHERPALVTGDGKNPVVHYWLARSTNPKPDPRALPSQEELSKSAVSAISRTVKLMLSQRSPNG